MVIEQFFSRSCHSLIFSVVVGHKELLKYTLLPKGKELGNVSAKEKCWKVKTKHEKHFRHVLLTVDLLGGEKWAPFPLVCSAPARL